MKRLIVAFLTFVVCTVAWAGQYGRSRYEISVSGICGYNTTWRSYGGGSIDGFMPVCRYFEADAGIMELSPGTFSCCATARPKLQLSVGELFLDAAVFCRSIYCYSVSESVAAASMGYRMNHVSVQAGIFSRKMTSMERITEPVSFLYRLSLSVRPASSSWNIEGGGANYSLYEYEREWQPSFFLNGYYGISPHLRVNAGINVKPAGMMHLLASFYGVRCSAGLSYIF